MSGFTSSANDWPAANPDAMVHQFLQGTYRSAADRADWHRVALEVGAARWNSGPRYPFS